jgi:hypothetical protein
MGSPQRRAQIPRRTAMPVTKTHHASAAHGDATTRAMASRERTRRGNSTRAGKLHGAVASETWTRTDKSATGPDEELVAGTKGERREGSRRLEKASREMSVGLERAGQLENVD